MSRNQDPLLRFIPDDPEFQNDVKIKLDKWTATKIKFNYNTVEWWEAVVKPGIKNLAVVHTKRYNESKYGKLNMLYLKQKYYLNKIEEGNPDYRTNINLINMEIKQWFIEEAETAIFLINAQEIEENETLNLYHHDLHKKKIQRAAITTLSTPDGIINGHKKCSEFITKDVANLLENEFKFDDKSQKILLNEVVPVFTEKDNFLLRKLPSKQEIKEILQKSNHHSAPGLDGITYYFYYKLFHIIGNTLVIVLQLIFKHEKPTFSQRTCNMVFAHKPGKSSSKELKDKRKISLLNTDFKILTSIENKRFSSIISHLISPAQFALGKEKRIHHTIALARDTIFLSKSRKKGGAIADFKSAFDLLCMEWVFKVLEKKD